MPVLPELSVCTRGRGPCYYKRVDPEVLEITPEERLFLRNWSDLTVLTRSQKEPGAPITLSGPVDQLDRIECILRQVNFQPEAEPTYSVIL